MLGSVRLRGHADANFPIAQLQTFRAQLHACFFRRADALFELGDALLCAQAVGSLPHLSLEPIHQRGWASTYAALACGQIDAEQLRDLLVRFLPPADPLVFAVDVTTWPQAHQEAAHDREGRLTSPARLPRPPTWVDGQPGIPWVKSQA